MNSWEIILAALALDLLIGDPRNFPHPVRWIGKSARGLAAFFRARLKSDFWAGLWTAAAVYAGSLVIPFALIKIGSRILPWLGCALSIYVIYATVALRDLIQHSAEVYRALTAPSLQNARKRVGMMVGRDTRNLSKIEIIRACVESVAENMVDGVTAPLFFAVIGGAPLAMLYRSVNTLDSLFGYKNEELRSFGKIPAKMDDLANYLPARITSWLIPVASFFLRLHPLGAARVLFRDGRKNPSPNSGLPEAAVAGALGVRLGGENFYGGVRSAKPFLGEENGRLESGHIVAANRLVFFTSILTCAIYLLAARILRIFLIR